MIAAQLPGNPRCTWAGSRRPSSDDQTSAHRSADETLGMIGSRQEETLNSGGEADFRLPLTRNGVTATYAASVFLGAERRMSNSFAVVTGGPCITIA